MSETQHNIPESEIDYHPTSFADSHGRLFWWHGELFRGISEKYCKFYQDLLSSSVISELIQSKKLIGTQATPYQVGGYQLVLKHRQLMFVSYPNEWCFSAMKDAALLVLDIQEALAETGLTLHDAHPWNIVFDGYRPVYVDFTSIAAAKPGQWLAQDEFYRFFINPLKLMANGNGRIARLLLSDYRLGITSTDVNGPLRNAVHQDARMQLKASLAPFLNNSLGRQLKSILRSFQSATEMTSHKKQQASAYGAVQNLRREIDKLELPTHGTGTEWSSYYDEYPGFDQTEEWNDKHRNLYKFLSTNHPQSVLDIGCNKGWFSELAAHLGSSVVAFDTDEVCVEGLYHAAKSKRSLVQSLVMDAVNPSPGLGLHGRELAPASQRLRAEAVLALALVHHLVFKAKLKFDYIVDMLSMFTQKWLVVEFISKEDKYVSQWWTDEFCWYTIENFRTALAREFKSVELLSSSPSPRLLLICQK